MTSYATKYRSVARSLSRIELMRSSMDVTFKLSDFDMEDRDSDRLFLDFYGDEGIQLGLERYGIFDALRRRGWGDVTIETHAHEDRHTLLLDGKRLDADEADGTSTRLFELVIRRDQLRIQGVERGLESLTIDWVGLRNPGARFTEKRLRLPGQDSPGLGMGERVLELLFRVVVRLKLDGLLTVAEHFHLAVLYARELAFVDPFYAGQLGALTELLYGREGLSFAQAAWAMHWGFVRDVDDSVLNWRGEAMVNARDEELRALLTGRAHLEHATEVSATLHYSLDRAGFDERWAAEREKLFESLDPEDARS